MTEPAPARLRHVNDAQPGIARLRCGRGFRYLDAQGRPVRDSRVLARIGRLAIPPAWREVWICVQENGHLQATGRDARGRKQYRYHPDWVRRRSRDKFAHIVQFGAALPALRRRLRADLALPGLPRQRVLAIVVSVMEHTLARVGNVHYLRQNRSYGLTTLRNRHLQTITTRRAALRFRGKSGQIQAIAIEDRRLAGLIARCRDLPGESLFQYVDDSGQACPVDSGEVNAYLQAATGAGFTAKDFRTWGATVMAFAELAGSAPADQAGQSEVVQRQNQVIATVARALGNTPAVCRSSYIDPCVFAAWQQGRLRTLPRSGNLRRNETAALKLLRACHRS